MKMMTFWCVVALILLTIQVDGSIRWLAMDQIPQTVKWHKTRVCSKLYGLTGRQVHFCKKNFRWMSHIYAAAQESKFECHELMQARKWNCASVNRAPNFNLDLRKDTREASFVYALSVATLALKVARSCISGNVENCTCDDGRRQLSFPTEVIDQKNMSSIDAQLGCKHVLHVGKLFASKFLDLGLRKKPQAFSHKQTDAIKRHNINVGLKALEDGAQIVCVCNGATAGCVVKYCYRRIVHLPEVAEQLLKKYDSAVEVKLRAEGKLANVHTNEIMQDSSPHELVYAESMPDPCSIPNQSLHPTLRRQCDPNSNGTNSCKNLCCGRGYLMRTVDVAMQCNCRFQFCCKVKCDTCQGHRTIYECV